jgi:hypothetical protein
VSRPWTFGDIFVLRHPGFPFDWLEELGISSEVQLEVAALLEREHDLAAAAGGVNAKVGRATATAIDLDRPPPVPPDASGEWATCHLAWVAQRRRAESAFRSDRSRLQRRLHELASDEKVQEAVFLSSPDVFDNVWSRYVENGPRDDGADARRTERLVYSYLQRLCAKNETTSFFGPMGYGEIAGDDDAIEILPAEPPRRTTFVAYWAVEALASAVATEPELWSALPLRKNPLFVIDEVAGDARCEPLDRVEPLSPQHLRLLAGVSRSSHAPAIAEFLHEDLAWVESVAMSLLVKGVLVRRVWFRSDQPDSLANLRSALEALTACPARSRWLANLKQLDALRAEFESATLFGRRELLRTMELFFTQLSRTPARRAGGRLYTDRLILNEEASSPFRMRIGRAAAARLAASLSPAFDTCAAHGEELQREAVRRVVAALEGVPSPIGFLRYATLARGVTMDLRSEPRAGLGDAHVIDLDEGVGDVPQAGPRFALPDLCLGRSPDGSIHPILSGMHHQLLTPGWLFAFHAESSRVERMAANWMSAYATMPLAELATGRHNKGYYSFPGPRVAHAPAELERGGVDQPVFAASECSIAIEDGHPILREPDGGQILLYLPLADLTLHAPFMALSTPPVVFAPVRTVGCHTPRLDRGAATYQREQWEVTLDSWKNLSGFALFAAMQRVRARHGLPRFVFADVPAERKPFLVDTRCPFAVDLLKHLSPGAHAVTLEEMLPSPDELWLRDERGRYTFELRIQAQRGG